jgi:transcription elongation GreA/GreB family factor
MSGIDHGGAGPGRSWLAARTRQRLERELAELRVRHRELDEAISATDGVEDRGDQAQRLELAADLARTSARIREITEVLAGRVKPSSADVLPEGTQVMIRYAGADVPAWPRHVGPSVSACSQATRPSTGLG